MSLGASWEGLGASWEGLKASWGAPKLAGSPSEPAGRPQGGTDGRTDERTEFLPILQDFVPYRGRCPKTRKTEKIPLCGDAIGHRPLRGRCPLTTKLTEKLTSKKLIRGHREPLTM